MGDVKGFLKISRKKEQCRPIEERVNDYNSVYKIRADRESRDQASRCMDCGTPFCHSACPLGNIIPEWNDLLWNDHWQRAYELLNTTNPLPEVTGRVCPALCEYACVLSINDDAVTIRENELAIVEHAFKKGLIKPKLPKQRTEKNIAIVGSGPAGLACADQLNRSGHKVAVYERDEKIGGIMRFGIPDFKLDKKILDRRIAIWQKEGIEFKTNMNVGINYPGTKLLTEFDAVCLAGGCRVPRDILLKGRELQGIYFAMDYLTQSNKRASGLIDAKNKKVLVIGGGDTGSDCIGTAVRQGAKSITQIEIMPKPLPFRSEACAWPKYPLLLKTTSSHEEGANRYWSIKTKEFVGKNGKVMKVICEDENDRPIEFEADLVIIAAGFIKPESTGLLAELDIQFNAKQTVATNDNYQTNNKKVFCCGDMRRGQSLVVWALFEGQECAREINRYLK